MLRWVTDRVYNFDIIQCLEGHIKHVLYIVGLFRTPLPMDNYQMIIELCSQTITILNFLSVCQKSILGLTHYIQNMF